MSFDPMDHEDVFMTKRAPSRMIRDVPLSEAGVEALGLEPMVPRAVPYDSRLAPTPREEFLLGNLEHAEDFAAEHFPGDDVEAWLKRELFVSLAAATGVVDADMLFGEGRDGTAPTEPVGLLEGLAMLDTDPMTDDAPDDGLVERMQAWVSAQLAAQHQLIDAAAQEAIALEQGVLVRTDVDGLVISAAPDPRVPFLEVWEVPEGVDVPDAQAWEDGSDG